MNILFLSLVDFDSLEDRRMYTDLLREFRRNGHAIYAVSPVEKRKGEVTRIIKEEKTTILKLSVGNIQKTNLIEKGISTLLIEYQVILGIKKYFSDVVFDFVLYVTPPITFCKVIDYVKIRDGAKTYLMLKDIFPQNAIDIGMLKETGVKGILYRYFRSKEKRLYAISDTIGCMSQANCDYILRHNPELKEKKIEICPNSIDACDMTITPDERNFIREKYGIPLDKKVFVYGGNLGKPQGITFIIECLKSQKNNGDAYFLIVGSGTEYKKLESFYEQSKLMNMKLMHSLPKSDYDQMIAACDVGLIFLDHRFTIPNFPSRLLGYMQAKLPILACTDVNTDLGDVITAGGFGYWCESTDVQQFDACVKKMMDSDLPSMGTRAFEYLKENYTVEKCYARIIR